MDEPRPGAVMAQILSIKPSLMPAEQQVAQVLLDHHEHAAELSSQQVAELAGTSRATVVRACQSLGFSGFQQVRVLLTRDAAIKRARELPLAEHHVDGVAAPVYERFARLAAAMESMTSLLQAPAVEQAVRVLARAQHIQVAGNALSRALAMDAVSRLLRLGLHADHHSDTLQQQIAAKLLGPDDALLAVSGSGSHADTLSTARAAQSSGAHVIAITAFARSPLALLADTALVIGVPDLSFGDELTDATRIPQMILLEGLVVCLKNELGPRAAEASAVTLAMVSEHVEE